MGAMTEITIGPRDSVYRIEGGKIIPVRSTRFSESFPIEELGTRVLGRVVSKEVRSFSWGALFRSIWMALRPGLVRRVLWMIIGSK